MQRRREIAFILAIAIGLIVGRFIKKATIGLLIGLALGLVVALAGTRVMGSLFVCIKPSDPLTFIVVVLLLTGIALFACWIPAYCATRIDPLAAMRYE